MPLDANRKLEFPRTYLEATSLSISVNGPSGLDKHKFISLSTHDGVQSSQLAEEISVFYPRIEVGGVRN